MGACQAAVATAEAATEEVSTVVKMEVEREAEPAEVVAEGRGAGTAAAAWAGMVVAVHIEPSHQQTAGCGLCTWTCPPRGSGRRT